MLVGENRSGYDFSIFRARGVRRERLNGSVYRYWSSYAIAHLLDRYSPPDLDILDAGGRDGGTVHLLNSLGRRGRYTCLDIDPKGAAGQLGEFEVEVVRSAFGAYRPARQFDVVLFESSFECIEDWQDVAWLRESLKPEGVAIVTLVVRSARMLYPGFWAAGARFYRDRDELEPGFASLGLRIEECRPMVGLAGRIGQYVIQLKLAALIKMGYYGTLGRLSPKLRAIDVMACPNRLVNATTVVLDRVLRCRPVGHYLVLRRD